MHTYTTAANTRMDTYTKIKKINKGFKKNYFYNAFYETGSFYTPVFFFLISMSILVRVSITTVKHYDQCQGFTAVNGHHD